MDQEEGSSTARLSIPIQAKRTSAGGGASSSSDWPPLPVQAAPAAQDEIDESMIQALADEMGDHAEVDSQEEEIPPPWHPRYLAWEAKQSG